MCGLWRVGEILAAFGHGGIMLRFPCRRRRVLALSQIERGFTCPHRLDRPW
jgi:hypothetical protein